MPQWPTLGIPENCHGQPGFQVSASARCAPWPGMDEKRNPYPVRWPCTDRIPCNPSAIPRSTPGMPKGTAISIDDPRRYKNAKLNSWFQPSSARLYANPLQDLNRSRGRPTAAFAARSEEPRMTLADFHCRARGASGRRFCVCFPFPGLYCTIGNHAKHP